MAELLSIEEARGLVLERVRPLASEPVGLEHAPGRVLAEPARAAVDLPPFDSSAMDGYALRAADTPGRLAVAHRIAAGRPAPRPLAQGEAMAIATGGVVPEGADAVVPLEHVVEDDGRLEVPDGVAAAAHVRPRGGDVRRGETVVEAGARLGPGQLGALAAAGVAEVLCARRPSAVLLTTGTELRPPGAELGPGEIYESNGVLVAEQLASAGASVERLASVQDVEDEHRRVLERALGADLVVSTGGVSVGPHDLVRGVGAALGVEEVFWRVAVKPGKPIWFGVRGQTLVFGLPGNPVSALVCCELFVRPAVLALQGAADPGPRLASGRLARAVRRNPGRDELARASSTFAEGEVVLEPVLGQESHMIVRAASADALVLVPRGEGELAAGQQVTFLPLA